MRDLIGVGKAVRIGVEDEVDGALRPARHRLRLVLPDLAEPEPGEQAGQRLHGSFADGELDELDAEAFRPRRQHELAARRPLRPSQLVHQVDQRAMAVDGDAARRAGPELVVEDLERQRPVIAGRQDRLHEIDEREFALAREAAEMAAPLQHVHVEPRRVGELDEEDLVARNGAYRLQVGAAREKIWKLSRTMPIAG